MMIRKGISVQNKKRGKEVFAVRKEFRQKVSLKNWQKKLKRIKELLRKELKTA
ncbi:hypothetical protein BSNK01_13660 [Bacillaceae bacterium]